MPMPIVANQLICITVAVVGDIDVTVVVTGMAVVSTLVVV